MKILKLIGIAVLMLSFNTISAQLEWVKFETEIPSNAVIGGVENHRSLAVCRCNYKGAMHPGKVVEKNCNIGYGGVEVLMKEFEVLVNKGGVELDWLKTDGSLPEHTVKAGAEKGNPMYVGRIYYEKSTHPGKIFKGGGRYICNIGYGGKEITQTSFEFLVEVHHPDKFKEDKRCAKDGSYVSAKNVATLSKERKIVEGFSMVSKNFEYQARVTDDGRLVVDHIVHYIHCDDGSIVITESEEIWTNTTQKGDASKKYYMKFQDDGNLCIYSGKDTFVWCSMSNGLDGHHFEITNMGHIEVVNSHGVEVWPDK